VSGLLLVSGKGGVGKTSVSCALALRHSWAGRRVLLVSTDPAHNLGHAWDLPLGDDPRRVVEHGPGHVDAVEIDPAAVVERHLAAVGRTMRRLLPEHLHGPAARHLDQARHAPGTHESAVLERLAELVVDACGPSSAYDLVVVDTAPTGHTLRLVALPERLTTWTEGLLAGRDRSERLGAAVRGLGGGDDTADRDAELRRVLVRRRQRFATFRDLLVDPARAGFVLVTAAERLPVAETAALHGELHVLGIGVTGLVVNRRSPDDGGLLAERRRLEEPHVESLRRLGVPLTEVPLLPGELVGVSGLGVLAERLEGVAAG
jgi:arsenite-transporting ATPase